LANLPPPSRQSPGLAPGFSLRRGAGGHAASIKPRFEIGQSICEAAIAHGRTSRAAAFMTVIGFLASMMANSAMMDGGLGVHARLPLLPTSIRRR
jgi:hypothetical protein